MISSLPKFVRSLPKIFYAAAVLEFMWRFWNDYSVAVQAYAYEAAVDGSTPFMTTAISGALYWAFVEAAYMIANGAVIHVLIAIYDTLKGSAE